MGHAWHRTQHTGSASNTLLPEVPTVMPGPSAGHHLGVGSTMLGTGGARSKQAQPCLEASPKLPACPQPWAQTWPLPSCLRWNPSLPFAPTLPPTNATPAQELCILSSPFKGASVWAARW